MDVARQICSDSNDKAEGEFFMSTSTIKGNMTTGNPLKLMMQFALPLLMGNLLQQTYNIIDAAIVGQILGAKALASVGSRSSIQFLVLGFCMGSCAGFGVPIAKYFGAGDLEKMKKYEKRNFTKWLNCCHRRN